MKVRVTWYDNAAFRLDREGETFWFDPAINKNPDSPIKVQDIREPAKFVFTTHGDPGHFVNSVEITKKTGARFVAPYDLCDHVLQQGLLPRDRVIPLGFDETKTLDDAEVYLFEAVHPELTPEVEETVRKWGGVPTRNGGFVVRWSDLTLCILGDCIPTAVFGELGRKFSIDLGMIPLQGKRKRAAAEECAENGAAIVTDLRLKVLLPVIQYTREKSIVDLLRKKFEEAGTDTKLIFDKPGTSHTI